MFFGCETLQENILRSSETPINCLMWYAAINLCQGEGQNQSHNPQCHNMQQYALYTYRWIMVPDVDMQPLICAKARDKTNFEGITQPHFYIHV